MTLFRPTVILSPRTAISYACASPVFLFSPFSLPERSPVFHFLFEAEVWDGLDLICPAGVSGKPKTQAEEERLALLQWTRSPGVDSGI